MSSRWPSSLLNAANQRLTERIETTVLKLEAKRTSVAEQREVVALLKRHQQQTQQQVTSTAAAVEQERVSTEQIEGALRQLLLETDANERRSRQAQSTAAELRRAVAALEAAVEKRREGVKAQEEIAVELEEEVKEVVAAHLSRQRVGDELAAAQHELSSTVWARLDRLHRQVHEATERLAAARHEHSRAVQDAEAMQQALQDAVKDQVESVRALELVHTQTSQLDAQVLANAKAMEGLKELEREQTQRRSDFRTALERLLLENKHHSVARDQHREQYDRQLHALHETLAAVREAEVHAATSTYSQQAEVQQVRQQQRELEHIAMLCEEKTQLLKQQAARHDALAEARAQLRRDEAIGQPSPAALRDTLLSLTRQEALLEDRMERVRGKLESAIQAFMNEGHRSEHANAELGEALKTKEALDKDVTIAEDHVHLLKARLGKLEETLVERQTLLPSMQALASEQRAQRQASWMREVEELRGTLLRAQRDHQQLLQGTTTLRSSLHQTRRALESQDVTQATTLAELRLLGDAVDQLERELTAVVDEHRMQTLRHEQAGVALQSLMKAADAQVGAMREAVGVESFLRAEVQIEEARLQADTQAALVELHLHENQVRELNEELQRHRKKLGLLRMRYEEVMETMTRAAQKPLKEECDGAAAPLLKLDREQASSNPEVVHAHLLLRRSYEREQLMQRGNYLDLRVVALERETGTLRHMLDGLRSSPGVVCDSNDASDTTLPAPPKAAPNSSPAASPTLPQEASCSAAAAKEQLLQSTAASEQLWKAELQLLDETLGAMSQHREDARARLHHLRTTLKDLHGKSLQKRMHVQKLRDELQRTRRNSGAVAAKRSKVAIR